MAEPQAQDAAPAPAPSPDALVAWDGVSLEAWPELKAAAEAQLGETEDTRAAALLALRAKLDALPEAERPLDGSDRSLLRFLRARKFRVDDAYEVLVAARQFEVAHPEWCTNLKAEEFREMYQSGFMRILRGRDRVGRRVSILLPMRFPEKLDAAVMMRWNMWRVTWQLPLLSLARMGRCPYLQVLGAAIYENFEVFSFRQSMKLNASMPPSVMRANFHYIQKCAPYRLGGILVANQPRFMTFMWALVRPFMSAKLKARVRLLGTDFGAFATEMDPALLPPEFGGTLEEDAMAWFDEQCALEAAGQ